MRRNGLCAFGAVLALVVSLGAPNAVFAQVPDACAALPPLAPLSEAVVEVRAADGRVLRFDVEVAATGPERQRGLMCRETMEPAAGMLFIFENERALSFWMRNTLLPLDIIYFDAAGRFVSVQARAAPLDETGLPSAGPAKYVLEINGGLAQMTNLGPGSTLRSDALEASGLGLGAP